MCLCGACCAGRCSSAWCPHTAPRQRTDWRPIGPACAGVLCVLRWLGYTPPHVGDAPLVLPSADPPSRQIAYAPAEGEPATPRLPLHMHLPRLPPCRAAAEAAPWCHKHWPPPRFPMFPNCANIPRAGEKLDARAAIAGRTLPTLRGSVVEEAWQGGLLDKGTWTEAQAGWARTVVTGRARLGGVPVGVVAVEVNTVMLNLPADPGMPDSSERTIPQVGALPCLCCQTCGLRSFLGATNQAIALPCRPCLLPHPASYQRPLSAVCACRRARCGSPTARSRLLLRLRSSTSRACLWCCWPTGAASAAGSATCSRGCCRRVLMAGRGAAACAPFAFVFVYTPIASCAPVAAALQA